MARGTSLGQLLTKLRIAARYDPSPALSKNFEPLFVQTIQDVYERLYDEFDWPFLKIQRDKVTSPGQRYYDLPTDMDLERVVKVDVLFGTVWKPVERGITLNNYSACNSDAGARRDPVDRWDVIDTGNGAQVELWPVPATTGTVRFRGIRQRTQLVSSGDLADLDDQLIILNAAAELLAGKGNEQDAQLKLKQAEKRLALLQGRVTKTRNSMFVLGGDGEGNDDSFWKDRGGSFAVVATQSGTSSTDPTNDDPGDLAGLVQQ